MHPHGARLGWTSGWRGPALALGSCWSLAGCATNKDSAVCANIRVPQAEIYAIDVSFATLSDKAERDYLNQQPTSFVLPPEAVDRLRAAAGTIIQASPEFQRLLKDTGARVVVDPAGVAPAAR